MSLVLMTSSEVINMASNYINKRSAFITPNDSLEDFANKLRYQINVHEGLEKRALQNFNIESPTLVALQKKFTELNNGPLNRLANNFIKESANSFSAKALKRGITINDIADAFKKYVENILGTEDLPAEVFLNNELMEKEVFPKFLEGVRKNHLEVQEINLGDIGKKTITTIKAKFTELLKLVGKQSNINKRDLGSYAKDIQILINATGTSTFATLNDFYLPPSLDITSYYPYINLTEEQKEVARNINSGDGKIAWENFKNHIKTYLYGAITKPNLIDDVLNQYGPEPFFVYNMNGLLGIMGELQVNLIFSELYKGEVIGVGQVRNKLKGSAELGADILMDKRFGIQVKNYSGYKDAEGNQGYHLRRKLQWSTLEKRIPNLSTLSDYFAMINYNVPLSGSYKGYDEVSNYKEMYKQITSGSGAIRQSVNAFFSQNINSIFTIREVYKFTGANEETVMGAYANVFFVFGGEKVIPTSYILRRLLYNIETLQKALASDGESERFNLNVTSSYNGPVYPSPFDPAKITASQINSLIGNGGKQEITFNGSSYKILDTHDILGQLSLRFNLNIYLEDLNLEGGALNF